MWFVQMLLQAQVIKTEIKTESSHLKSPSVMYTTAPVSQSSPGKTSETIPAPAVHTFVNTNGTFLATGNENMICSLYSV